MNSKKMPRPQGPCSELHKYPHSNLFKNRQLRLDPRSWGFSGAKVAPEGVYFIRSGEYVKIGKSKNPKHRIYEIQTAHFNKLELLHIINFSSSERIHVAEKCLHKIFEDKLTESKNEWFSYNGRLREFIETKPSQSDFIKFTNEHLADETMKIRFLSVFKRHLKGDYFCTWEANSIQRDAKAAAETLEYLQYMLLDISASKPKRCKEWQISPDHYDTKDWDWVKFTEVFINASFVSGPRFYPKFKDFFHEKRMLSELKATISYEGKLAANDFFYDT